MLKHFFTIFLLILVFFGDLPAQSLRRSVEAGKVIVQLQPDAVPVVETTLRTLKKSSTDTSALHIGIQSFDRVSRRYRASAMRRVFPDAGEYEAKHRKYGLHLWYEITIPEGEDPETAAIGYGTDENVQIAEPRYKIRSMAMPAPSLPFADPPDDPNFSRQWNFHNTGQTGGMPDVDIRLPEAWERVQTLGIKNNNVIVAVTDGGVYYDHEDLNANMWVNEAELNGVTGVDDDGNGYVDDIYGYNFVGRTGVIVPEDHATHVAGTIAAVTGNGTGVAGIAGNPSDGYGIRIMTVQILDDDKSVLSIGPAFTYAADNGAVISQNSWGYEKANNYNHSDVAAINYFINEAGRDRDGNPRAGTPMTGGIVIFAAGNDGKDDKWYPAYFDNVLAVAAVNHYGKRAWYSNFGKWVDISAPGGDTDERGKNRTGGIYSTSYRANNKNYYEYMQGTSMACPHVSGVAALILSVYGNENFTPDMLRTRLLCTATPLDVFDPANAPKMGAGLVNASTALAPGGVPDKITDLTAQPINAVSCRLNWTVPQMENNGEAGYYIVSCATEEITEENFDRYARTWVAMSQAAGTVVQATFGGLAPETDYYVAIRTSDNLYQTSETSNVTAFATPQNIAPVISGLVADATLIPFSNPVVIDLAEYTYDFENEPITYTVQTDNDDVVDAAIDQSTLTINPLYHGHAALQITATDPHAACAAATIHITVEQKYAPEKAGSLRVYPTPATDVLWFSYILDKPAPVSVRIMNPAGQIMFQSPIRKLSAGAYYDNIDLSGWSSGVYFVQYIVNGKSADTKKVVKL